MNHPQNNSSCHYPGIRNRRILVIDDAPSIHEDFWKIFTNGEEVLPKLDRIESALFGNSSGVKIQSAFEIDSASQGEEGLVLVRQAVAEGRPYAMAFVDVRMPPGWDGVETTTKIWEQCPDLEVVLCTAYSDYSLGEMLKRLGDSDRLVILKKPFDNIEVLQLANALTAKWQLGRQARCRMTDLERMVRERTAELQAANQRFREESQRATELAFAAVAGSKAKGEFLGLMTHEIRNPLDAIIGMTNRLLDSELTPEQRGHAGTVKQSTDELLEIFKDILDFTKTEAGRAFLEPVEFDLARTVRTSVRLLVARAHAKGLSLRCVINPILPATLRGDPHRLRQILLNLVGNAIKFTEHGEVAIEISQRSETAAAVEIRFAVRDTGIGLTAQARQKFFEPFPQASGSTVCESGGTGPGLAICRKLVRQMSGEIGTVSEPGQGSTFWFDVRFEKKRISAPNPAPTAVTAGDEAARLRALLVDDNRVNQRLVRAQLQKLGCTVETANDGREAVAARERTPFDVIFMDCHMPEMDGFEATRKIRALEKEKSLPRICIIAITASTVPADRENCFASGMDEYLAKPVETPALRSLLIKHFPNQSGAHFSPIPALAMTAGRDQ